MFIRSAYFLGRPVPGKEAQFRAGLQQSLPMYGQFPKIRAVQLQLSKDADEGAPDVYATLQLCFDSESDLQAALATPHRQTMRAYFATSVTPLFAGSLKHINHDAAQYVAASPDSVA